MDLLKLEYEQAEALGRSLSEMQWDGSLIFTPALAAVTQGLFHYHKIGDYSATHHKKLQWHHKMELLKYADEVQHYLDSLGYFIPFKYIDEEVQAGEPK